MPDKNDFDSYWIYSVKLQKLLESCVSSEGSGQSFEQSQKAMEVLKFLVASNSWQQVMF